LKYEYRRVYIETKRRRRR